MAEMSRQFNQPIRLVTKMPVHKNVEKNMPSIPLRESTVISPVIRREEHGILNKILQPDFAFVLPYLSRLVKRPNKYLQQVRR